MPAAAEAMNRDEILAEIDDMIEVLRRYVYDERHNRVGWRDRNEIMGNDSLRRPYGWLHGEVQVDRSRSTRARSHTNASQ